MYCLRFWPLSFTSIVSLSLINEFVAHLSILQVWLLRDDGDHKTMLSRFASLPPSAEIQVRFTVIGLCDLTHMFVPDRVQCTNDQIDAP